jgi:hypothetical protein
MLEWKGGGISLMACGGGCCVESTLESFLDYLAEIDPRFCCFVQLIPIFKCTEKRPVVRRRLIVLVITYFTVYGF